VAPYVPVLVVLVATSVQLLRGRPIEPVAWWVAFALALLVLGREVIRFEPPMTVGRRGEREADGPEADMSSAAGVEPTLSRGPP